VVREYRFSPRRPRIRASVVVTPTPTCASLGPEGLWGPAPTKRRALREGYVISGPCRRISECYVAFLIAAAKRHHVRFGSKAERFALSNSMSANHSKRTSICNRCERVVAQASPGVQDAQFGDQGNAHHAARNQGTTALSHLRSTMACPPLGWPDQTFQHEGAKIREYALACDIRQMLDCVHGFLHWAVANNGSAAGPRMWRRSLQLGDKNHKLSSSLLAGQGLVHRF